MYLAVVFSVVFFSRQKTAYELSISDWSSDVCSSDLTSRAQAVQRRDVARALARIDRDALIVAGDMNLTPWAAAMREQDRALAPLVRMTRALPSWPRAIRKSDV